MAKKSRRLKKLEQQHYHYVETDYSLSDSAAIKSVKKALHNERKSAINWGFATTVNAAALATMYATSSPNVSKFIAGFCLVLTFMEMGAHLYNIRKIKQCFNEYLR